MAPEASDAGSQARHNGVTISRLFSFEERSGVRYLPGPAGSQSWSGTKP